MDPTETPDTSTPLENSVYQSALAEFIATSRTGLLPQWLDQVYRTPELRMREDTPDQESRKVLIEFFNLICNQTTHFTDFGPLRDHIHSGSMNSFTPDAACRLQLAFKKTLLGSLHAGQPDEQLLRLAEKISDEILLRIADFYHEIRYKELQWQEAERTRVLRATQERLKTLLETMNEGFTAIDTSENLIMFNHQMERITGYGRQEAIGQHLSLLYTEDSMDRLQTHLARRRRGESSSYELQIAHKSGHEVPVRISGAPLRDAGGHHVGSFAVITDISDRIRAENELRDSNEKIVRLLEKERNRAAQFATINQVAKLALSTLDLDEIFKHVVREVHERFPYHHITLFTLDDEKNDIVMRACAGAYEAFFTEGYRQQIGYGIVGTVVERGESIVANDTEAEPTRILAFPEEASTRAELCVPIKRGDQVIGALDVQSQEAGIFDENDVSALQVLSDQIAWVIHNASLFQETLKLKEFNEQILQSIPLPVFLLDPGGKVVFANANYMDRHKVTKEELIGRPLEEAIPKSILVQPEGKMAVQSVFRNLQPVHLERQRINQGIYQNRMVNVLVIPLVGAETPLALVLIEDITDSIEKAYESSLLRQIGQTMQGVLDLDRLLYTILTCVTAGTALGFNRAILLLVNKDKGTLEGKMGVGPSSQEEAAQIWSQLEETVFTVDHILADYDRLSDPAETTLSRAARQIQISLGDPDDVLAQTVRDQRTLRMEDGDPISISAALWAALGTNHFVAQPLIVKNNPVGVIVADNLYSGKPITNDSIDLLSAFASHAVLALENAELYRNLEDNVQKVESAYRELERTQEELVRSERLAVIGEMSARMAHEIRNPMATIGGFARSILKQRDDTKVEQAASVIVEEVERLEKLLADTLNFTRPTRTQFENSDPRGLLADIERMITEEIADKPIIYHGHLSSDLPHLTFDPSQIKQVLINIYQNALQAMPDHGEVRMEAYVAQMPGEVDSPCLQLSISDTGEGISEAHHDEIFSPFYTTKTYGTGLGLAISKKIVEDHDGRISIESEPGKGTRVTIHLPCSPERE